MSATVHFAAHHFADNDRAISRAQIFDENGKYLDTHGKRPW